MSYKPHTVQSNTLLNPNSQHRDDIASISRVTRAAKRIEEVMNSKHFIPRLRLPVSGLEQYLVDANGSLWKHGGERNGRDRRLSAMSFAMCMRRLGRKYSSYNLEPWPLIPGVWAMLHVGSIPDSVPYIAHSPLDELFRTYCFGSKREHVPGWPKWSSQIEQAASSIDAEKASMWFSLSDISSAGWIDGVTRTPVAVLGPLAFLAVSLEVDTCYPGDNRYNRYI